MRKFKGAEGPTTLTGAEQRRLVLMGIAAVLFIVGLVVVNRYYRRDAQPPPFGEDVEEEAHVEMPEIPVDALRANVDDRTAEARVRLERPPLEALFAVVRRMTGAHYEALGAETLTPDVLEAIAADPAAWRGRAVRLRGELIGRSERRNAPGAPTEHNVTIALENMDGELRAAHGVVLALPEGIGVGDWLRIDGLFLKRYSDEVSGRGWLDGPLVVSARAERSYPPLPPQVESPRARLEQVVDDTLQRPLGIDGPGRFELLAHARDVPAGTYDFAAAPRLDDRANLHAIYNDGDAHRGQPFRLPISRIVNVRNVALSENPARLDRLTEIWIANTNWGPEMPMIGVHVPGRLEGLHREQLITGDLLFYKNHAFDATVGTRRVAPIFVGVSIRPFEQPPDTVLVRVLWAVAIATGVIVILLFVLLRRDRERSKAFERELLERRQRRRAAAPPRP